MLRGMDLLIVLFWAAIGSVISLIGGVLLVGAKKRRDIVMMLALPFGAGALLAAAFFDLLPEAIEGGDAHEIMPLVLLGFIIFFILERFAGWFHSHHQHEASRNIAHKSMIIIGDTLHNALDGVAIGAAFLIDVPTGIVTTLAVAAHEIPQEIGDFGLLLARGMRGSRAILANILSAIATLITAGFTFSLGSSDIIPLAPLLAITAGFFIYIAAADIIPEIHESPKKQANLQAGMLLIGILVVSTAITTLEHAH
jgi:zinc and cadmium transporter